MSQQPETATSGNRPATPESNDTLRRQIAKAIHKYDFGRGLSGNDIPSGHHFGEADAVLAVLAATQRPETTPDDQSMTRFGLQVQGRCPACGLASLFLGAGGYVTCGNLPCHEPDAASTLLEHRTAPQPETAPDTLPAWLQMRFDPRGPAWDALDEDDRAYWEHQARAVRRAAARNGFKAPEPTVIEEFEARHPDAMRIAREGVHAPDRPRTRRESATAPEADGVAARVRAVHYEVDGSPDSEGSCIEDGQNWPCATIRALTTE